MKRAASRRGLRIIPGRLHHQFQRASTRVIYMGMVRIIDLACARCSLAVKKEQKEYTRQIKKGQENFFCSHSCSVKYGHEQGKYDYKQATERIKKYSGGGRTPDAL